MATHSSALSWRLPRTEKPGGLHSIRSQSWTGLKQPSTCALHDRWFHGHLIEKEIETQPHEIILQRS